MVLTIAINYCETGILADKDGGHEQLDMAKKYRDHESLNRSENDEANSETAINDENTEESLKIVEKRNKHCKFLKKILFRIILNYVENYNELSKLILVEILMS